MSSNPPEILEELEDDVCPRLIEDRFDPLWNSSYRCRGLYSSHCLGHYKYLFAGRVPGTCKTIQHRLCSNLKKPTVWIIRKQDKQ